MTDDRTPSKAAKKTNRARSDNDAETADDAIDLDAVTGSPRAARAEGVREALLAEQRDMLAAGVLSATVEADDYETPDTEAWWFVLTPDAPCEEIAVGANVFRRSSRRYEIDPLSGQPVETHWPGCVAYLTTEEAALLPRQLRRIGIRVDRNEAGAVHRSSVGRLAPGMEPAAWYCCARRLREGEGLPQQGTPLPPPALARDKGVGPAAPQPIAAIH